MFTTTQRKSQPGGGGADLEGKRGAGWRVNHGGVLYSMMVTDTVLLLDQNAMDRITNYANLVAVLETIGGPCTEDSSNIHR